MEEKPSEETSKDENQLATFRNDSLVDVEPHKLYKGPTKLSVCFAILAILFFIIMVIFIILYFQNGQKICTSQECLRTASNYRSSMNDSVDPCDNFYEFVCGRWSEEHLNHAWTSSLSSFHIIKEKIIIDSINILSEEIDIDNDPEAVKMSKKLYKSCLDIGTLDKLGVAAMYPYLEKMNLPIVPSFMTTENKSDVKFNWMLTDTLAKQVFEMDIFIGYGIEPNIFNTSQQVLSIGRYLQEAPLPREEKVTWRMIKEFGDIDSDTAKELARNANINLITYVMNEIILNKTGQEAVGDLLKKAADVIIEMNDFVDEIITNTTHDDQPEKEEEDDQFSITVENLQNEINDYLKKPNQNFLTTYFGYLFNGTNVTINTKSDLLYVTKADVDFLKRILDYLAELPDINIELYSWWKTVSAMMFNTSRDIAYYISKQVNAFYGNKSSIVFKSRSMECASFNHQFLEYAISYALADRSFRNDTKTKVENMMLEIKEEFLNTVKSLTWIDAKTKNAILEKIKEMSTFIGYPNWMLEKGELDKYYKNIIIKPDTFLENMVNIITTNVKKYMNSLREIWKRDEWDGNPIEVNAHYIPYRNSLDILMAILNFPAYNLGLESLNYGAIGAILGHEMIHGFDNGGRKFDKDGHMKQWWTNQTIEHFENLTECFVKQYEHFILPGVIEHVNGKLTLGENVADNGGLNQAFKAYTSYIRKYGEDPKLPGFENYSNDQLFFIAYGNLLCETTNARDLKMHLKSNAHSPKFVRILGTLQNSEYFANTFKCPKDSPMNPMKKCKIW